jgi:ankyrin repeat protein
MKSLEEELKKLRLAVQTNNKDLRNLLNTTAVHETTGVYTLLFAAINVHASRETFQTLVEYFNQQDLSLDRTNANGRTVLDDACLDGYFDAIEVLIRGGAEYQHMRPNSQKTYLDFYLDSHPDQSRKIYEAIEQKEKEENFANKTKVSDPFLRLFSKATECFNPYRKINSTEDEARLKKEPARPKVE